MSNSVLTGRKTSMPLLKRIAVVYDSIIDYIHMTRIINKRTGRIFLTNRPVILKNPTE